MLKIGFIGSGFVAEFHARALESVRGAELSGLMARSGSEGLAASARARGLGETRVHPFIRELCEACDVIALLNPNYARLDAMGEICDAVEDGAELKGIVFEKPLARTCQEAAEMVTLADRCELPTAYFENQLQMPTVRSCRTQLARVAAAMGPVHLARSAEEHGGPHKPWFWDPRQQGGGAWNDLGCHSVAVGAYLCTPEGKHPSFLIPEAVTANLELLKWGVEPYVTRLRETHGVDYREVPAEDYAAVTYRFRSPETDRRVIVQCANSWMYDAPGLRVFIEAFGPGYSYTIDSTRSPSGIFISDTAAGAASDAELALEKSQASRGALTVVPDEPALYGYVEEWRDALACFQRGSNAMLDARYGAWVTRLVMAGYYAHEQGRTIHPDEMPDDYVPAIQQGRGAGVL